MGYKEKLLEQLAIAYHLKSFYAPTLHAATSPLSKSTLMPFLDYRVSERQCGFSSIIFIGLIENSVDRNVRGDQTVRQVLRNKAGVRQHILSHAAGVAVVPEQRTDLLLPAAGLFSAHAVTQMHLRK